MIRMLLDGHYERIALHHVRMAFSDDMDSVGRFRYRKLWILFTTIIEVAIARLRTGARVLYYPPAGPNTVPVLRDVILLTFTRWMFRHTVFHFHAGGVSGHRDRLPALLRPFFDHAYGKPDLAIRTARQNPDDGAAFQAARSIVVPNGIPDMRGTVPERVAAPGEPLMILFAGVLVPSKGVRVLIEAFIDLLKQGVQARLQLMGRWGDPGFERECRALLEEHDALGQVEFLGVLRDRLKFLRFAECDVFCFPSYFEAESFGLVLVEAMQFAKPVVSTHWRGIPSVVEDGVNGYLAPVRDPAAITERLRLLASDRDLRERMGEAGRRIFQERFTLERFHENMEKALSGVDEGRE